MQLQHPQWINTFYLAVYNSTCKDITYIRDNTIYYVFQLVELYKQQPHQLPTKSPRHSFNYSPVKRTIRSIRIVRCSYGQHSKLSLISWKEIR